MFISNSVKWENIGDGTFPRNCMSCYLTEQTYTQTEMYAQPVNEIGQTLVN